MHYRQNHFERNHSPQMSLWLILQELIATSQIFSLPINIKEKSTDSKITAVYGCRACHCLGNLQIQHSRTNVSFCLALGFLREGKKCIKAIRTNAMLLFNLKPVVCPASSQPWNAVVLHWEPAAEFVPAERHKILLQIVLKTTSRDGNTN